MAGTFSRRVGVAALVLACFGLSTDSSFAVDFTVPPDSEYTFTVDVGDRIVMNVTPDRSYCFQLHQPIGGNGGATFSSFDVSNPSLFFTATDRGEAYPRSYGGLVFGNSTKSLTCVVVTGSTSVARTVRGTIGTSSGAAIANVRSNTYETTLFGNYNTSVTDFNFLELTNRMVLQGGDTGVINGFVVVKDSISDTEKLRTSFTVNPGDRIDVDIHAAVGEGNFGTVQVFHNGVPGALKGAVAQYRILTASPLTFEPVSILPLERARD